MLVEHGSLSRGLLENELLRFNESGPRQRLPFTDRDRRMVSSYRSFVRYNIIKQKRDLILEDFIFTTLAKYLCTSPKISYEEFCVIAGVAPPAAHKFFTARSFLKFPRDENQCINSEDLVRYIERTMEVETATLNLMDTVQPGCDPLLTTVTEQQLETFLIKMIPEIDIFQRMHESFTDFYAYTAVQKFVFFLDTRKTNALSIKRLAHSKEMEELQAIRRLALQMSNNTMTVQEAEMELNKNWFSYNNAEKIYNLFLELDKDQNGFLSMNEVADFAGLNRRKRVNFTRATWERLFEEYVDFSPRELDYKSFVRLVLALENSTTPASIRYFWRILDIDKSGRLTATKIKYFYRDVHASLADGYDVPSAAHVIVEVFDLLACNSAEGATLDDFLRSKQGHVVISMLLDVNGFWRYDNRESLMGSEDADDGASAAAGQGLEGAGDALDALLGPAAGGSPESPQRKVVGSVLMEEDEVVDLESSPPSSQKSANKGGISAQSGAHSHSVSAAAKSKLLSQVGKVEEEEEDEYDDEIFSDDDI